MTARIKPARNILYDVIPGSCTCLSLQLSSELSPGLSPHFSTLLIQSPPSSLRVFGHALSKAVKNRLHLLKSAELLESQFF